MNIPRDKRFYEYGDWLDILDKSPINKQPKEIFHRFVQESIEDNYRMEYYWALAFMQETGPDWEDLTEEQRHNIREEGRRHALEMQEFGKSLSQGK